MGRIYSSSIAYFSMEIGLDYRIPTYAGGLGILAGDTIKSFADTNMSAVAVTLVHRKGYFFQKITQTGEQLELSSDWVLNDFLKKVEEKVVINIEGRDVIVNAWYKDVKSSVSKGVVRVYFLDTKDELNSREDKKITDHLYGGDHRYRLHQEIVLGIGGLKLLKELGYNHVEKYHLNEGHSGLLVMQLYKQLKNQGLTETQIHKKIHKKLVFTTHTSVPAGHDSFSRGMFMNSLRDFLPEKSLSKFCTHNKFNMTKMCMDNSGFINAVSKKHEQVTRQMFPKHRIHHITNGIHHLTWTNNFFKRLYDKKIAGWRKNPKLLSKADKISKKDILLAHEKSKKKLIDYLNEHINAGFDYDILTIGFARRMTGYKRPEILLDNIPDLDVLSERIKGLQIVYSGKAHPNDMVGKRVIKKIIQKSWETRHAKVKYLNNYDMNNALKLVSGVDVWLNHPKPPLEASGTSGMKAAINGVPNLSVLDGWWIEGHKENQTGWGFNSKNDKQDVHTMINIIKNKIAPTYKNQTKWSKLMKNTIKNDATIFNTQRMVKEYQTKAYK